MTPERKQIDYEHWMREVNAILSRATGVSADDMADFPSRDEFDHGATPYDGARACLEWSDAPEGLYDRIEELERKDKARATA